MNGTSINVTTLQGVQLTVSSTNNNVVVADLAGFRLNGVGNGTSNVAAQVTASGFPTVTTPPVTITVTP